MPRCINSLCARIPQRMVVCALMCGSMLLCYMQRSAYYAATREMVYGTHLSNMTSVSSCPFMISTDTFVGKHYKRGEYVWSADLKRAITQAFYIGFLISNIPFGMIADFYGARGLFGTGLLASSMLTLLYPKLAKSDPYYLMLGRFFGGIFQSMVWTSEAVLVAQWAPHSERTTFISIIDAGKYGGILVNVALTQNLKPVEESWEAKFYMAGVLGVLWSVGWYLLVYAEPARCPHMSDAERALVHGQTEGFHKDDAVPYPHVPWKQMFKSQPFLALLVYHIGSSWIHFSVTNQVQVYLTNVVHLTTALTYDCFLFVVSVGIFSVVYWGALGDWLINHNVLTRTNVRKLCSFLGEVLMIPLMFGVLNAGCNALLVVAFYMCMLYMRGITSGCIHANIIDLSPQYAGVIMGIMNCWSSITSLFSREFFRYICDDPSDPAKWFIVYLFNTCMILVTCLPYLWKGSGEIQQWNYISRSP